MSSLFVVEDSSRKITSHADVKCVAPTRNDVGAIDLLLHLRNLRWLIYEMQPQVLRLASLAQDDRFMVGKFENIPRCAIRHTGSGPNSLSLERIITF